jgi:hypothetical protein
MNTRIVEDVPSFGVAAVRDCIGRRKKCRATITAQVDNTIFTTQLNVVSDSHGRRWLKCPCGTRRKYLYVQDGRVGCRKCFHLLYWQQTAISRNRWRESIARPAFRALRRARSAEKEGFGRQKQKNAAVSASG